MFTEVRVYVSCILCNPETACTCIPLLLLNLIFALLIFSRILDRRCHCIISVVIMLWLEAGTADFSLLQNTHANSSFLFSGSGG